MSTGQCEHSEGLINQSRALQETLHRAHRLSFSFVLCFIEDVLEFTHNATIVTQT